MAFDLSKASHVAQIASLLPGGYCAYAAWVSLHTPPAANPTPSPHLLPVPAMSTLVTSTGVLIAFGAFVALLLMGAVMGYLSGREKLRQKRRSFGKILEPMGAFIVENTFRSRNDKTPCGIRFINKTESAVDIYWINYQGVRERQYAGLGIGAEYTINTYLTHPFVVVVSGTGTTERGSGKLLSGFEALTSDGDIAIITEARKTEATRPKLTLHSAFYGAGGYREADVLATLVSMPHEGISFLVDNSLLPAGTKDAAPPGVRKRLTVKYSYGDSEIVERHRWDGLHMTLPVDDDFIYATCKEYDNKCAEGIESLKKELSRVYPQRVLTIQKVDIFDEPPHPQGFDRVFIIITNSSGNQVDVWTPTWSSVGGVQLTINERPCLELERTDSGLPGWKGGRWGDPEQQCVTLMAGATCRCWLPVLQPYGEGTAIRLKHKTLGVAEFPIKIQGRFYFYPIDL